MNKIKYVLVVKKEIFGIVYPFENDGYDIDDEHREMIVFSADGEIVKSIPLKNISDYEFYRLVDKEDQ